MGKIKIFWANKWVKFAVYATIYTLWFVVWSENLWMLLGIAVIFDIFITKNFQRLFWNKHQEQKANSVAYRKTMEWVETIIFAVVVASIIRIFVFSMYVIPSSSMEKSLLVGDYLYVSKIAYGPQLPNTPLSFPLVHNMMPFSKEKKSYLDWFSQPYHRIKGFGQVKHNDAVVFNFPEGDTVALVSPGDNYYRIVRDFERTMSPVEARAKIRAISKIISRPVDKRDNYIKRAVALPGDSLQVIEGVAYINGKKQIDIAGIQYIYRITTNGTPISADTFEQMGIANDDIKYYASNNLYETPLTATNAQRISGMSNIVSVNKYQALGINPDLFPHSHNYAWNEDNYGPIWIPAKGVKVELNAGNLPLYKRIIEVYEGNKLEVNGEVIYINGAVAEEYVFKMDYYFMMGDNRHCSSDSRFWGFVPEDHIVGKATFIWFSTDKDRSGLGKVRWSRIFTNVK